MGGVASERRLALNPFAPVEWRATPALLSEDCPMAAQFVPMSGEETLYLGAGGKLRVTTHRVRWDEQGWGFGSIVSIMLTEVDSCQSTRRSYPWLIVLAVLIGIATGVLLYLDKLP